jgi:hypothetical protein
MALPANNLFLRLHKWAHRQDKNFCTEALALVLQHLLDRQPDVGVQMIKLLTKDLLCVPSNDAGKVELRTQVITKEGRPDIVIRWTQHLVVVEVKVGSDLHQGQLPDYQLFLRNSGLAKTGFVLLTRYPPTVSKRDKESIHLIRWHEVANGIDKELRGEGIVDPVTRYLCEQFVEFLGARGMNLTQVGKYLPEGLRALGSLLNMLKEAAAACKVSAAMTGAVGLEYIGLSIESPRYWIGVYYASPEKLWFGSKTRIGPEAASKLGVCEPGQENGIEDGYYWQSAELDSEPIHFFARTKVGQIEWLEKFLRECLTMARSIETPDQPPIPDEPEGQ